MKAIRYWAILSGTLALLSAAARAEIDYLLSRLGQKDPGARL